MYMRLEFLMSNGESGKTKKKRAKWETKTSGQNQVESGDGTAT